METTTAGDVLQPSLWRSVEQSPEVASVFDTLKVGRYLPRPNPGLAYYFLPLDQLPWPASSDPAWYMDDVQEFFVEHFKLDPCAYPPEEVLYACTRSHGEIVIVPSNFLRAADLPRDDAGDA